MSVVHAREAAITTCTVDLRILAVNGRSMTVAVFNQLPWMTPEALYNTDIGEWDLWGWVNRCDRDCDREDGPADGAGTHLHYVFQHGGLLYQHVVRPREWPELYEHVAALPQLFIGVGR